MTSYSRRVRALHPRAHIARDGLRVAIVAEGEILAEGESVPAAWRCALAVLFPQPRRRVRRLPKGESPC